MRVVPLLLAFLLLIEGRSALAADDLCRRLQEFRKDQFGGQSGAIPRHWVEFHWGIDPNPNTIWSWGCRHSDDTSSDEFCDWLMDNTSREFPNLLAIRVQECMGYKFPKDVVNNWWVTEGEISQQFDDGSWLRMEITEKDLQQREFAIRLSVDSVDFDLEPDELPPVKPLPIEEGDGDSVE